MAGDHKCPVCQATFTRPQHVARHMRSHTGDRPYKCQHCGDQFARSDLLSRHVNKCHAGDKPPTTTAPTRRKGLGASSTRATTSKQACDQCVMSTLPCDGANPCSKCVQRKNPCTYVKFQRQTAPVGPGHKYNPSTDSLSSTSSGYSSSSIPRADELFLVPPPMTVPSMGVGSDMLYAQQQFAFNPPSAPSMWDSDSPNPPSLSLSGATDSGPDTAPADLGQFRQQGGHVLPPGYAGAVQDGQGFYQHAQQPGGQWQVPADYHLAMQQQPHRKVDESFAQYLPQGSSSQIGTGANLIHPANFDVHGNGFYNLHTRRGSVDGFSDGGSVPSGPNSASSSNVHLPLDFGAEQQQQQQQQQQQLQDLLQYQQYNDGQAQPPSSRDGRFATSFGTLSLNDGADAFQYGNPQNQDGYAPFFTQNAMKLTPQESTPRPFRADDASRAGQPATPRDRDAEMRELREFWKQYLRTPLTGPGLGQTPKAEFINSQLGALGDATRPTPKRGLSRVASLPSVRTPLDEKNGAFPPRNGNNSQSQAQLAAATDDLKRYEEAILARKPLNLQFIPRKGRLSVSSSSVSPQPSHQQPGPLAGLGQDTGDHSDAESASSATGFRPSFKRLPSQTLENTVQKRANFRWDSEEPYDDTDSEADAPAPQHRPQVPLPATRSAAPLATTGAPGQGQGQGIDAGRYRNMQFAHTESLLDRYRRQSLPTGLRPPIADGAVVGVKMEEHSPSPASFSPSPMPVSPAALPPPGANGLVQS